jgi:hypothetical protein
MSLVLSFVIYSSSIALIGNKFTIMVIFCSQKICQRLCYH